MTYLYYFLLLIMQIYLRITCHLNIPTYFFIENKKDGYLPLTDVNIFVKTRYLKLTSVEKIFSGVYTNF